MSATASQITGISIVYSTICSGADQRKYQSSPSLTFERGIHRWPVDSPHKGPVTRKCIYSMTSWCLWLWLIISKASCYLNHAISEFFYHKNDPTYNIHADFMQIYILHFRNSGVGSMELENAFCCPIGDICIIIIMTLWESFSYSPLWENSMLWTYISTLLLYMELMHIVSIIVGFFHKSLKL